jgi:hypothetical protein
MQPLLSTFLVQTMNRTTTPTIDNINLSSANSGDVTLIVWGIVLVLLVLLFILIFIFIKWLLKAIKIAAWEKKAIDTKLFEVRLPQSNETEISAADQLYAGLSGIAGTLGWFKKQVSARDFISFEIVAFPENIRFYVLAPSKLASLVEKQINAAYPDAEVTPSKDYNVFPEGAKVAYTGLKLTDDSYKPIKTYEELNTDSLSVITSSMSKLAKGEAIVYQMVITPAGSDWRNEGKKYVNKVRDNNSDPEKKKMDVDDDVLAGIEKKTEKGGFFTDIRLVSVSPDQSSADGNLKAMISAFDQFKQEGGNGFKKSGVEGKNFIRDFVYRIPQESSILNTAELSTLFHFPNQSVRTPHIHWLLSKRAPAGPEIEAKYTPGSVHLADSIYRDQKKRVYLKLNDRRRHLYIVGKTGAGKTNFLQRMILQDIYNGHGLAFLDPHGDAAEHIIQRIPPERAEDVIYFNPSDAERPMGFNIMEYDNEQEKYRIVESFLGLLNKMFDPHNQGITGPRFQQAVRNGMLTAMSVPGTSLVETVRIITDDKYAQKYLPFLKDEVVKRYWTDQIANTQDFHKSEILGHVTSKFEKFVTNKLMRNIIAQSKSSFNMRDVMDNKKILIVNLSKGLIGEENSQFLGLLMVPKILNAAMSRADIPEDKRNDFFLYVDEFQNFATEDFAQILSEARKYRLNLIVANQYIAQIEERVRDAVFGNVGTMVSFKVGVNDANYLQNEYNPVFDQNDLINLENYNIYTKMLVDGEYPSPFSAKIPYDPEKFPTHDDVGPLITELSRLRYGRDRQLVEDEINQRANMDGEITADGSTSTSATGSKKGGFKTPLKAADKDPDPKSEGGATNKTANTNTSSEDAPYNPIVGKSADLTNSKTPSSPSIGTMPKLN